MDQEVMAVLAIGVVLGAILARHLLLQSLE
jgi:hypothetical protein